MNISVMTMPEVTNIQQPNIAAGADTQSNTSPGKNEFSSIVEKLSSNNPEKEKTGIKAESSQPAEENMQVTKENPDTGNSDAETDQVINNENIPAEAQAEEGSATVLQEGTDNKLETLLAVLKGMTQEAENKCSGENNCSTGQTILTMPAESAQDGKVAVPAVEISAGHELQNTKTGNESTAPMAESAKTTQRNILTVNQENTETLPEGSAVKSQNEAAENETDNSLVQKFTNTEKAEESVGNKQKSENENNGNLNSSNKNVKETEPKIKTGETLAKDLTDGVTVKDSGEQKKNISDLQTRSENNKATVSKKAEDASYSVLNEGHEDQNSAMSDSLRNIRIMTEKTGVEAAENAVKHGIVLKNTEKLDIKLTDSGSDRDLAGLMNVNKITGEGLKTAEGILSLNSSRQAVINELMDRAVFTVKGNNRIGVAVEHETLGKLNIKLSLEKGVVNVQIDAADKGVRELVENNIQQIIESLSKSGINVGDFSVALKNQRNNSENWNRKAFGSNSNKDKAYSEPVQSVTVNNGIISIFA